MIDNFFTLEPAARLLLVAIDNFPSSYYVDFCKRRAIDTS